MLKRVGFSIYLQSDGDGVEKEKEKEEEYPKQKSR